MIEGQLVVESRDQNILSAIYISVQRYQIILKEIGQKFRETTVLNKTETNQMKNMAKNSVNSLFKTHHFPIFLVVFSILEVDCIINKSFFTKSPIWRILRPPPPQRILIHIDGAVHEFH